MSKIAAGFVTALIVTLVSAVPNLGYALTLSAEPGATCFSADPTKCIGGVYTLDVTAVDADTWEATYTMDLTLGLEVPATTVEQIEIKVAKEYSNIVMISGPDGAANWSPVDGPLGGSGCKGNNASFICLDAKTGVALPASTYVWKFQFDAASVKPDSEWHIGARFASPDHQNGWILSASSSPIPEPRSTALYLLGGLLVAGAIRKQVLTAR